LDHCKTIFIIVGLVGLLLFFYPTASFAARLPEGKKYSEIYILGLNQLATDIPFNIVPDISHTVYLGVANHTGFIGILPLPVETEKSNRTHARFKGQSCKYIVVIL